MGGKFRGRMQHALVFDVPDPVELARELQEYPREDWILEGRELRVKY
jgi:hypothetical protein